VDSRSADPQAVWTHPKDGESPTTTTTTHAGGGVAPPGPNQNAATPINPDTRPLPDGWISEYSPDHKTFFYVNTKAADPGSTVTWTHPAEAKAGTSNASTRAEGKQNPDTRPLPPGWITDYAENYNAWFYVNTRDPASGSNWTHPADTHSHSATTSSPAPAPGTASTSVLAPVGNQSAPGKSPQKVAASLPSSAAPVASAVPGRENPDKRPLPPGWIAKFDENYNTWYYVDTSKPGGPSSWEHPADKHTTSPVLSPTTPGGSRPSGASNVPPSTTSGAGAGTPQNPDKRPLPAGWVTQYDRHSKKWFYVKTTEHPPLTSWQHPLDNAQPTPTPNPSGPQQAPNGPPPGNSTTPGAGKGLEGLLGSKAGGMVGGLFGAKGRAQMDGFADMLGSEINRYTKQGGKGGTAGVPAPSQAPPGPAPSQYQPPTGQAPGQYVAPPASQPPPTVSGGGGLAGKFGFGKK
jgi:hypothetical protein